MKVFKFGGASVCSSQAIRNLGKIIQAQKQKPSVIVVSAMGKSTNMLEAVLSSRSLQIHSSEPLIQFKNYHLKICQELFPKANHDVKNRVEQLFSSLEESLEQNESNFDKQYDQVVSHGELLSSAIVHAYLQDITDYELLDAREIIVTDSTFRQGQVRWDLTKKAIGNKLTTNGSKLFITQGFIAADEFGNTVTLGREGSDFSAAIIASCLGAESVTIWKDVPGVLNADPDKWSQTLQYQVISYGEAAEMTYYGASVIHPKTIRPLAVKSIPLIVKSFLEPDKKGTKITDIQHEMLEPAIIFKENQCLISFQVRDYSFINESKVSMIFHLFEEFNITVNMIQSSAISFSVCVDNPDNKMKNIINSLGAEFDIFYNDQLVLITVKNYRQELIDEILKDKEIMLEQRTRRSFQALVCQSSDADNN